MAGEDDFVSIASIWYNSYVIGYHPFRGGLSAVGMHAAGNLLFYARGKKFPL